MLEWDWRFETDSGIVFGSSSSNPYLDAGLAGLAGQNVVALSLEGGKEMSRSWPKRRGEV